MFDIDIVYEAALEANFPLGHRNPNMIEVLLTSTETLVFEDLVDQDDTIIYFKTSSWHSHGDLFCEHYETEVEFVPMEILRDLRSGKLLITKHQFPNDQIDMSLQFGDQMGDVNYYLGAGEAIAFRRLAPNTVINTDA